MESLPVPVVRCPVCADAMPGPVRECERCGTPHHPECWDYVPGCAVFGCAEQGESRNLPVQTWPAVHQLAIRRARTAGMTAGAFQLSIVSFAVAAALDIPPSVIPKWLAEILVGTSFLSGMLGMVGVLLFLVFTVRFRWAGGAELVKEAREGGDRKLRSAIESRVGALLPVSTPRLAYSMGFLIAFSQFLKDLWATGFLGPGQIFIHLFATAILTVIYGVILLMPLLLGGVLVGSQRVLANRIRVSLPDKTGEG